MATYTVTTANWNDGAFWASVGPADPGHVLDFSGLPSTYSVTYNYTTGEIVISDGATTYTIGDANATGGPYDTTLGGTAELNFFDFLGSQGDDTVIGDANANAVDGSGAIDEIDYSGSGAGVNVDLGTGTGLGGDAAGDTYANIENVTGSAFDDTLTGDGEANVLDGGGGADTIIGGGGDDTVTGGAGDDVYVLSDGFGNDRILDFDTGDSNFDGIFNDQLDVTGLTDALGNPVNVWDVTVTDDGAGNALLTFPNGETLVLIGVAPTSIDEASELNSAGVICFAEGTLIRTPRGEVPVEALKCGDRVETMDNGAQPIVWAGKRVLGPSELDANSSLKPIRVPTGLFGNHAQLFVSPQHGILLDESCGAPGQQLARARHLAEAKGPVRVAHGKRRVSYFHLMFDAHQIVWANGAPCESFYPGPSALQMFDTSSRREVCDIVEGLDRLPVSEVYGDRVRPFLKRKEVLKLIDLRWLHRSAEKRNRMALLGARVDVVSGNSRILH